MALDPEKPVVKIGGIACQVDQAAPEEIQRPAIFHQFRPIFTQRIDITGRPGAQNLREDRLPWHISDWGGGEGQVVLQNNDEGSARRFFRSEGLDFRTAGQVSLNRSVLQNNPVDSTGGATATSEGSAWSAITGTITDTGDDTRLNEKGTTVAESASFTPGVGQTAIDVHMYKEAVQTTTIEASAFIKEQGKCPVSGTDRIVPGFSGGEAGFGSMRTDNLVSGTDFAAGVPVTVTATGTGPGNATLKVFRGTGPGDRTKIVETEALLAHTPSVTFTPTGTNTYHFHLLVVTVNSQSSTTVDKMTYGATSEPTEVQVRIRNHTDSNFTNLPSKTVQLSNTTTAKVATLNFNSTAAKEYRVRVTYNDGNQRPLVDKAVSTVNSTTASPLAAMELGWDGNVVVIGAPAAASPPAFDYDFANENWDVTDASLSGAGSGVVARALAHSDAKEYVAMSDGEIIQYDESAAATYTTVTDELTGIAICQNRLFALAETSSGVVVSTYAVDSSPTVSALASVTVTAAVVTPDTTLRERMCGTPTGARFFVNYSDVTTVVYEVDSSGSTLVSKELTRLPEGSRGTAICYYNGYTFVAAQSHAPESGEIPETTLFVIDQSNAPRAIGTFRREDPNDAPVISMQPYGYDLWMLQGKLIWRYSLQTGGLFLEYELEPGDQSYARSIAVTKGHVFALFAQEDDNNTGGVVWVAGSVGTFRQSSVADGSSFTSSIYDYGLPGEQKTLKSVTVVTDDLPSNTSVFVQVQLDQDGTWHDIGTHTSGAEATFTVATPESSLQFRTIQVRAFLQSATGTATPTLKALIVESMVLGFEEFFDITILSEDEDSTYHVLDQHRTGGDLVQAINNLRRAGQPVTFVDGTEHRSLDNNPEYTCVFDTSGASNDSIGEGRMSVRLKVI